MSLGRFHEKELKRKALQARANDYLASLPPDDEDAPFELPVPEKPKVVREMWNTGAPPPEYPRDQVLPWGNLTLGLEGSKLSETGSRSQQMKNFYTTNKELKKEEEAVTILKKQMKTDHYKEYFEEEGAVKVNRVSETKENFVYGKEHKEDFSAHDFTHNIKKNDLNQMAEAYLKYKSTMRIFNDTAKNEKKK